jgi:hypothetical protein
MPTISRDDAVRLISSSCRSAVDDRTRRPVPSELDVLAHQRPEIADLVRKIQEYLDSSLTNSTYFRKDDEAIAKLAEALTMALIYLRSTTALAKDGGHVGVLASLQTSLESLRATLIGETLPDQQPLLRAAK